MAKTWWRSATPTRIAKRLARELAEEAGLALPLALGVMTSLSIAATSIVYFSTQNQSNASRFAGDQVSYAAAEAGLNYALRELYAAPDPLAKTLLPERRVTVGASEVAYSGALDERTHVWTLTARAAMHGPAGQPLSRTLRRTVEVRGINPGATITAWNRVYQDDAASCLAIENVAVPSPVATRGDICLLGTAALTSSVDAGGSIALDKHAFIGAPNAHVDRVAVGGVCSLNHRPGHQPCGPADHVYARSSTNAPQNLAKPAVDFDYWYAHAAPGPMHPCTTATGTPPRFDDNGVFDRSLRVQELTPSASSYTCEVRGRDGILLGALSWNHATHVLDVKGTIFVDGDIGMFVSGQIANYQGQATLYASGTFELRGGALCAGGGGNTNCRNSDIGNWDATRNLLVLVVGAKTPPGLDVQIHQTSGAMQAAVYGVHDCRVGDTSYLSGPLVCNRVAIDKTASMFTWPVLPELLPGQKYGSPAATPYRELALGPQYE